VSSALPASSDDLLALLPKGLRDELLKEFNNIVANYREARWEPAELDGGKYCEVVYSVIRGHADSSFPAAASKPPNMVDACKALEKAPGHVPRSLAIQVPRMLVALYEIRNNRGVGHVGGDVDPNHMDATVVLSCVKWILAELIRVFHATDVPSATTAVEALTERQIPVVWEVEGMKRVLAPDLTYKDRALILMYSSSGAVQEDDLRQWVEHPTPTDFRKILVGCHKARLIEYRKDERLVYMSPRGVEYVEENLPLVLS
jgi:hypothetical protein